MVRRRIKTANDSPAELRSRQPWFSFAVLYFQAGWYPLPLPIRKKKSPPSGTTGKYEAPGKELIERWLREYEKRGNIALRVPDNVIGIDVDAYDDKVGRASFAELQADLGPLPPTWTLTARNDGVSGIRFFRVPPGLHWSGEPIPDVQIVQHRHRYAVAYPSIHPDTRAVYRWYPPKAALNGNPPVTVEHELPKIADLPDLPVEWIDALSGGRVWHKLEADENATRQDLLDWLKARPSGEMCRLMAKETQRAIDEIAVGGAHDALNSRMYSIVSLASEGHVGVRRALKLIREAFYVEVMQPGRKGRRSEREASAEFNRTRDGAVRVMMASLESRESTLEAECACAESSFTWGEKLGVQVQEDESPSLRRRGKLGRAKSPDKYPMDDSGNAEHLLDILDGAAHYIPGQKAWTFWSPKDGCWQLDLAGGRIVQAAQLVGRRQRELAEEYNERLLARGSSVKDDVGGDLAGRIAALQKQAKVSSSFSGLINMSRVAQAQTRAEKTPEQFDADTRLVACPNGTLVLDLKEGVSFRDADRNDFCSQTTGTIYNPKARAPEWEAYLKRFLPDAEVRSWVQQLMGYCLTGGNPERIMVFLVGLTSTGKSTFINSLTTALGEYAGTMNLSLFRDNQDEKPRADLVNGLTKRMLTASEASAEWYLHGDQIKRLTGNDPIKARLLYSNMFVERIPSFVPIVATNTMPQIHGADLALRRRLVQVPFNVMIAQADEDHALSAALRTSAACRSAVLAWAVRGWGRYRVSGLGKKPDAVVRATQMMHAELSELDVFLNETVVENPRGWVKAEDLWERWLLYMDDNRVKGDWSANKFGRELTGRGYGRELKSIKGDKVRVRTGISWRKV
jgi:P4 family phage/plasmid primase-like protien